MELNKFIDNEYYSEQYRNSATVSGLFSVCGDFGSIDGRDVAKVREKENIAEYSIEKYGVRAVAKITEYIGGAFVREDCFINTENESVTLSGFRSRFTLIGRDYCVYTQYNGWQRENSGSWQKLVTNISCENFGNRLCDGAAPFMALKNVQTGKIYVFHFMSGFKWKITSSVRQVIGDIDAVVVELGINDDGLLLEARRGETLNLGKIFFYEADDERDFDGYKLHRTFNELYPAKTLPVVYNSWLYNFDHLDYKGLIKQINAAADMGIEAFMIDAGWFGEKGAWSENIGEWKESKTGALNGRLKEISEQVRACGMKFGLWFEPARVSEKCGLRKEHPEYYIEDMLLNFASDAAREFITERISDCIKRYDVGWVKFDFNITKPYVEKRDGFYSFYKGYDVFINDLKRQFPDLYITICGAGGYMTELYNAAYANDFWISDDQSLFGGIEILKGYIKRMPPSRIARYIVNGFTCLPSCFNANGDVLPIYTGNATWSQVHSADASFAHGFATGGTFGFSCDLSAYPEKYKKEVKSIISAYKKDREFFRTAEARILCDAENLTVLQYSDKNAEKCIVQIFTKTVNQERFIVYPIVDKGCNYIFNDVLLSGKEISENGIILSEVKPFSCKTLSFDKKT